MQAAFSAKNTEYCVPKDPVWRSLRMKGLPRIFSVLHAECSSMVLQKKKKITPKNLRHVPSAQGGCF